MVERFEAIGTDEDPYIVSTTKGSWVRYSDYSTLSARVAQLEEALGEARKRARNIWGAISSDQVVDKDVEGQAKRLLEFIDAALSEKEARG